jgi:hypothetical protein
MDCRLNFPVTASGEIMYNIDPVVIVKPVNQSH